MSYILSIKFEHFVKYLILQENKAKYDQIQFAYLKILYAVLISLQHQDTFFPNLKIQ